MKLEGEIEQTLTFSANGIGNALIQIEIRNSGGSPTIAEKWLMSVKEPSGQVHKGVPFTILGGLKALKASGPAAQSPEQIASALAIGTIMDNAAKPVPEGGAVRGWLPVEFLDTRDGNDLVKPGFEWTVSFTDVSGKRYETKFTYTGHERPLKSGPEYYPPTH